MKIAERAIFHKKYTQSCKYLTSTTTYEYYYYYYYC